MTLSRLLKKTVFWPVGVRRGSANEALAALFHRTAVTLYLFYAIWGIASIFAGLPGFREITNDVLTTSFAALVAVIAVVAAYGACFFPKTGRLELFAGSSFISLIVLFLILSLTEVTVGLRLSSVIFFTSVLVVPVSRTIFIYTTMINVAKTREKV